MAEATGDGALWGFGFIDAASGTLGSYAIACTGVIFADGFEQAAGAD